jgi:hypothetical protein
MKPNTLFQVRFKPSVTPPIGWKKSGHYNVLNYDRHHNKYLIGNTWLSAKNFIKIEVQDAPVFDKPVLRKIASLKENECIEIPNDIIRDLVLEQAEREGLNWLGGTAINEPVMKTPCHLFCRPSSRSKLTWPNPRPTDTILPASKFVEVPQEKEEPITETQKEACKAADERIKELENETITKGEQTNVATGSILDNIFKEPYMDERQEMHQKTLSENNKLYSQLETIKRLAKIAIQHEDYEHMRVILKSIATGEI